jgi:hypothetical protein
MSDGAITVRITSPPDGDAPLWVRQAWVAIVGRMESFRAGVATGYQGSNLFSEVERI